jgi:hypothetical protein
MGFRRDSTSSHPSAPPKRTPDAQRQEAHERRAAAEVGSVLTVEGTCVAVRVLLGGVALRPLGATSALTAPAHRVALAGEPEAVAEQAAAKHGEPAYAEEVAP